MTQKTNLNAAPYYDDFDKDKNYVRTLFRPGFAVQARELTQLQSQLQYQIEAHGSHIFKEGAAVVPGQSGVNRQYSLKLATQFGGENVDPSKYFNANTRVIITVQQLVFKQRLLDLRLELRQSNLFFILTI